MVSREIWQSLGVEDSHILTGNAKDNFWGQLFGSCGEERVLIGRNGCYRTLWTLLRDSL